MGSDFWPFQKYGKSHTMSDLLKNGVPWRDIRIKLQPDILSPQAAESYLPALTEVARQATKAFPFIADKPHEFTSRVAFDMFTASILGKSRGMLNPEEAFKEDLDFMVNSAVCMQTAGLLALSPLQIALQNYVKTKEYRTFEQATDMVYKRSVELVHEAVLDIAKREEEIETENVRSTSYLQRLIQSGALTTSDAGAEVAGLLIAAVDTTSNYMNWIMLHLARNPEKQKILAQELKEALKGGDFNKDQKLPYLQACYRESHRVTPLGTGIYRTLEDDIELFGYLIPAGTKIFFNLQAIQVDPLIVDDPQSFIPERWLPR
jgi:cytochrome P450